MPQISRKKLSDKVWQKIWQRFALALSSVRSRGGVEVLVSGLLTPTEEVMVAKRLMVGVLSLSGWKPYEIAGALKMSPATVYKLRAYLEMNKNYREFLKRTFPGKIASRSESKGAREGGDSLAEFLEDIFVGYRHRSRLYFGRVPGGR